MKLIEMLPFSAEVLILGLRLAGIAAILLAIGLFARGMMLNNALSAAKAHKMIHDFHAREMEQSSILVQKIEEEVVQPEKVKKPLLVFTITPEAQDLLKKITVSPIYDDGWNVTPHTDIYTL